MTVATAPASLAAKRGQATAAFTQYVRARYVAAVVAVRTGGGTVLGAAGLAATAVGAGAQWGWPVGLMVGGPLTVWFASLLAGGASK